MIKNINDFMSIVVLCLLTVFSFRFLLFSSFKDKNENKDKVSKLQLIRDYIDNVEE